MPLGQASAVFQITRTPMRLARRLLVRRMRAQTLWPVLLSNYPLALSPDLSKFVKKLEL
jgi:hypothetical protein